MYLVILIHGYLISEIFQSEMAEKWVIETVKFWIQFKTEEDIKIYKKNSTNIKTCKKAKKVRSKNQIKSVIWKRVNGEKLSDKNQTGNL